MEEKKTVKKHQVAAVKSPAKRRAVSAGGGVAVIVLGMHRSGTSATARVLNLLGCDLPKTIMGANNTNKAGHWESQAVARLNDDILDSGGSSWDDWLEFNPEWTRSPKAEEFHARAKAVLDDQFGTSRLFVLKDPRICRLPAFWLDVIREKGLDPVAILPLRNPLEVAASLQKRNGFDPALGQLLWLRHVLDAEHGSRAIPRYFTDFDRLMANWSAVTTDAASVLGISWPRLSDRAGAEIDAFLDEGHRHHREEHARVTENRTLSRWLRETYEILSRWAEEGESKQDFAALDRIRQEFTDSAPAFTRLVSGGREAVEKAGRLDRKLAGLVETLKDISARLGDTLGVEIEGGTADGDGAEISVEQMADRLEAAAEASGSALAEMRGRLAETESALRQRQHETEQITAELTAARNELQQLAAERGTSEKVVGGLKEHIDLLRQDLASGAETAKPEKTEALIAAARKEREESLAALADLQKKQEGYAKEIEGLRSQLDRANIAAEEMRGALAEEKRRGAAERSALEGRLGERFEEIAAMTRILEQNESIADAATQEVRRAIDALLGKRKWPSILHRLQLRRQAVRLQRSGLFDGEWYLARNTDVAEAGADPARHYIEFGAEEGREPNAVLHDARSRKPDGAG